MVVLYKKATVDELSISKLLSPYIVNDLPQAFKHADIFIFESLADLKSFITLKLLPKLGWEKLGMIRHFVCTPEARQNDFELLGVVPSRGVRCLYFNHDDFEKHIREIL